jgi:hypothetical protein
MTLTKIKIFLGEFFDADCLFAGRLTIKAPVKGSSDKNKIGRVEMCGIGQKTYIGLQSFLSGTVTKTTF